MSLKRERERKTKLKKIPASISLLLTLWKTSQDLTWKSFLYLKKKQFILWKMGKLRKYQSNRRTSIRILSFTMRQTLTIQKCKISIKKTIWSSWTFMGSANTKETKQLHWIRLKQESTECKKMTILIFFITASRYEKWLKFSL